MKLRLTRRLFSGMRAMVIAGLGVCLIWSCGNEVTRVNPGPSDLGSDTGAPPDTLAPDTLAPDAPPSNDTNNGKNVLCEGATADTGKGFPFTSFSYTPETDKSSGVTYNFDCTKCPGGIPLISGKYKLYEDDDLSKPDPKTFRETMTFDGNTFTDVLEGIDSSTGEYVSAVATGFYFCPDPAALKGIKYPNYWNIVIVYTDVEPFGAFNITPGVADICFLGFSINTLESSNDIFMECNFLWDPKGSSQFQGQYCKVGKTVIGQQCPDPFAE